MTAPPSVAGLRQPDRRSCGAACVVVAADLAADRDPGARRATFGADVLATHRRLVRLVLRGRPQPPWTRLLGTPPWAVARELSAVTGVRHRVRLVRWGRARRAAAHDRLQAGGALFVGDRWLPRHVVLALPGPGPEVRVYEPAAGAGVRLDRERTAAGTLRLAGWSHPWFTVTPV
ncbi:hypothetical protein [Nocardioides litoris]|uniref:hypothetical protein n=1 Tax=Nocardioides litoris TaxID=1926648 RepID=UPI00111CF940|nr:hypothetical protein [Nocardioides litoris]